MLPSECGWGETLVALNKVGIGVVGVGDMGRRHAHNLRRLVPHAQLLAVCDVAEKRAEQVAQELEIEHSFRKLDDVLERKDIRAVVIASPDKFHAQAIQAAAAAGKDILCEKPLALNLSDAQAALDAVAKAKVRLEIGFMRRYDPAHQSAMARIEAGEIGEPVVFKSIGRDKDVPPISAYQSGVNGMLFYNSTIHDFDLARWMMQDEIQAVQAFTTVSIRPEVEQYGDIVAGSVNLKFKSGAVGNVESYVQALYGYDVRTEVVGSRGSVFVGSLHRTPATFLRVEGATEDLADHFLSRFADAYLAEMNDFVHNVAHDRPLRVTGQDGLKALEIAVAAERSHLQHKAFEVTSN
jgi:scyllo-inositol 2-dehydrogenase (NAD+)